MALMALFDHAYTRRYPIPFLNARVTIVQSLPFFHKIGCHGKVPWDIEKRGRGRLSVPKTLSFGEKIAKIGPVHTEIFDKIRQTRREDATQFPSVILFSAETTGPIFTKILHDIVELVSLLNHAYRKG